MAYRKEQQNNFAKLTKAEITILKQSAVFDALINVWDDIEMRIMQSSKSEAEKVALLKLIDHPKYRVKQIITVKPID